MNLVEFNNNELKVIYAPLALTIKEFKKIVDRDKTKGKEIAIKELAFVSFYSDIRSIYTHITNKEDKINEIAKDMELPKGWKPDKVILDAIEVYKKRSVTINSKLYENACKAVIDVADYLGDADTLLNERDKSGRVVVDINKITAALEKVPKIMTNLNLAHQELIKEQKITEGRSKGSREFNMFEDGLDYDNE